MSRNDTDTREGAGGLPPLPAADNAEQLPLFSPQVVAAVKKDEAKWRGELHDPIVARKGPWKKDFTTVSGMEINPLATPVNVADVDFGRDLAFPGQFPYTRGLHPTGYRGKLWT